MRETTIQESAERHFQVKLYHPDDPGNHCKNSGQSERIDITASDESHLRTKVESDEHRIFKGDVCKKCGELAKVSVEEL